MGRMRVGWLSMVACASLAGCDARPLRYGVGDVGAGGREASGGAAGGGMGDGGAGMRVEYRFGAPPNHQLDMLFVIDKSPSMLPFQQKLLAQFPVFMDVLKMLPTPDGSATELPDIHVAVTSSDTGPGRYDLPDRRCRFGGDRGQFQYQPRGACAVSPFDVVPPAQAFLAAQDDQRTKNYRGDISDAFACIAALGADGCAFSSPLEAARWALDPVNPRPGNQGFLRPDADLAVVLFTNQDDCSVPDGSSLMDPAQDAMSDPLGPFSTFRCNEFGHVCLQNGRLEPPPRARPGALVGCVAGDTSTSRLTPIADEVAFLKGLKSDPARLMVSVIAGPATPYQIALQPRANRFGALENQPQMLPSCTQAAGQLAVPSVRLQQWAEAFANHGLLQSICANSFAASLQLAATSLSALVHQCGTPALRDADPATPGLDPDCAVIDQTPAGQTAVPACAATGGAPPCWRIGPGQNCEPDLSFFVTRVTAPSQLVTTVSCAICRPGFAGAGCP